MYLAEFAHIEVKKVSLYVDPVALIVGYISALLFVKSFSYLSKMLNCEVCFLLLILAVYNAYPWPEQVLNLAPIV